jgi:hypothetical protein
MKQVVNDRGDIVNGLFRKEDGSLVVVDSLKLRQAKLLKHNFDSLSNQINTLQQQVQDILVKINGIH